MDVKGRKILDAVGGIDDRFIEEALPKEEQELSNRKRPVAKYIGICAGLAAAIAVLAVNSRYIRDMIPQMPETSSAPMAPENCSLEETAETAAVVSDTSEDAYTSEEVNDHTEIAVAETGDAVEGDFCKLGFAVYVEHEEHEDEEFNYEGVAKYIVARCQEDGMDAFTAEIDGHTYAVIFTYAYEKDNITELYGYPCELILWEPEEPAEPTELTEP